jgi:hypothetical protein
MVGAFTAHPGITRCVKSSHKKTLRYHMICLVFTSMVLYFCVTSHFAKMKLDEKLCLSYAHHASTTEDTYGKLLEIGGGKERMMGYWQVGCPP